MPCFPGSCSTDLASASWTGPVRSADKLPMASVGTTGRRERERSVGIEPIAPAEANPPAKQPTTWAKPKSPSPKTEKPRAAKRPSLGRDDNELAC